MAAITHNRKIISCKNRFFYIRSMTAVTRLFIIQKSAPLFNKKGYLATSVADIMAATGLARVGIYDHFRSKMKLREQPLNTVTKRS